MGRRYRQDSEIVSPDEVQSGTEDDVASANASLPYQDGETATGRPTTAASIVAVEKVFGKRVAWLDSTGTISLSRSKMSPTDVVAIVAAVARLIGKLPSGAATLQAMSAAVEYEAKRAPLIV